MRSDYSFKKGLAKGLVAMLMAAAAIVGFAGFADFTLWELIEQYVKPLLGGVTVAGVLKFAINFVKFNFALNP